MRNLQNSVVQQKNTIKVLSDASTPSKSSVNPLTVVKDLQFKGGSVVTHYNTTKAEELAAIQAAMLIDGKVVPIRPSSYSYSYSNSYYGEFETYDEDKVISYEDLMGIVDQPTGGDSSAYVESQVALNSDASCKSVGSESADNIHVGEQPIQSPANEEKGIKGFWAKYKFYIIAALVLVLAVVAYKKL
jgi:hypothetical protein